MDANYSYFKNKCLKIMQADGSITESSRRNEIILCNTFHRQQQSCLINVSVVGVMKYVLAFLKDLILVSSRSSLSRWRVPVVMKE